jgi:hypothetical protein
VRIFKRKEINYRSKSKISYNRLREERERKNKEKQKRQEMLSSNVSTPQNETAAKRDNIENLISGILNKGVDAPPTPKEKEERPFISSPKKRQELSISCFIGEVSIPPKVCQFLISNLIFTEQTGNL